MRLLQTKAAFETHMLTHGMDDEPIFRELIFSQVKLMSLAVEFVYAAFEDGVKSIPPMHMNLQHPKKKTRKKGHFSSKLRIIDLGGVVCLFVQTGMFIGFQNNMTGSGYLYTIEANENVTCLGARNCRSYYQVDDYGFPIAFSSWVSSH
jgi:hypothetical protein